MAITDPQAIKFLSDIVRPLAEKTRALGAEYLAAITAWQGTIADLTPVDGGVIEDGREHEGVSRITGADVHAFMGLLIALREGGDQGVVEKPCVRPLKATSE